MVANLVSVRWHPCGALGLTSAQEHYTVVISGAGPAGLLTALWLGKTGIKTLVIEQHTELLFSTRGCAYQPVVINALEHLGVLDMIKEHAHLNRNGIEWWDSEKNNLGLLKIPEGQDILMLGQKRLNDLLLRELEKYPSVTVRFNRQYVGCEQDDDRVKIMIHQTGRNEDDNDINITADWLVAADGAKSAVRRSLCIPYEGHTFADFTVVGTDVYYDFTKEGYSIQNYVRGPEDWCGMLYTGENKVIGDPTSTPLWRVAYAEPTHLSTKKEDVWARAQERLKHWAPNQTSFDIKRAEPYRMQQRCAEQAIKGRVILVGDALHSNNPCGGYGLTTGILDACVMGEVLAKACSGKVPESLVAEAARDRRQTWLNVTNKISMGMYRKLSSLKPEDAVTAEEFFTGLRSGAEYSHKVWAGVDEIAGKSFVAAA
jgi:2-polyprenyl-6-methoxyphenol hydroxylase-like FAD-dependent oxidoreductase